MEDLVIKKYKFSIPVISVRWIMEHPLVCFNLASDVNNDTIVAATDDEATYATYAAYLLKFKKD